MKGKYLILVILITTSFHLAEAQKIVTLKECYDNAMGTNALAGEKSSNEQVSKLKDQNIATAWLPSLDANGSFVYNSSVIDMKSALGALPIPGIADAITVSLAKKNEVSIKSHSKLLYFAKSFKICNISGVSLKP